jgi:hypothetical protein
VGRHVAIRMPGQPSLARPEQPSQVQRTPLLKRMNVDPNPNARHNLHGGQPTGQAH